VLAYKILKSATDPEVIQTFSPSITQPPSFHVAVVFIEEGSLPA